MGAMPGLRHQGLPLLKRFAANKRGNVALIFAIGLPAMILGALGAVDLTSVVTDRTKMQAVADFAALNAAKQLALDTSSATATRAKNEAQSELSEIAKRWSLTIDAQVVEDGKAVQVSVRGHRPSYFHDMLPKGGWTAGVSATAEIEGLTPLCVLGSGTTTGGLLGLGLGATSDVITLKNTAHLSADSCLVQSNNAIKVSNSAAVEAQAVQSVGDASGSISPEPMTGAASIKDPFASLNTNIPTLCTDLNVTIVPGKPLKKGTHCGVIVVPPNTTLQLEPGEHYFSLATLLVGSNAKLVGTDVVLIFDTLSFFSFTAQSDIELEGRKSGPFAGFVIATTKTNAKTFTISTSAAHKLLGVVYIPNGLLSIQGNNDVAADSAWTVIVAKTISISGGANLVVNANYTVNNVPPVPTGVGPSAATSTVKLVK
jgi:Flp pilus assembly protein TadG